MSFLQIPIGTYPNTFLGYQSSISMTTGDANTAFGYQTLISNTTGGQNVAVGHNALGQNISGNTSVAVGFNALFDQTTGFQNVAIGHASAGGITTGQGNIAIGASARVGAIGSSGNITIGRSAGGTAAVNECVFIGGSSGTVNQGSNNTFIGTNSGGQITTGAKNTIVGSFRGNQFGLDIRTLSNHIVLSDGDGNPRLWINNTGDVNIPGGFVLPGGTANGVLYLNGSKVVTSGSALTFNGTTLTTTNVQLASSGSIVDGGGNATLTPTSGGAVALTSNGAYTNGNIVYNALAATGVHVFSVNSAEQMRLTSTGLGIGTSSPVGKLDTRGTAYLGSDSNNSLVVDSTSSTVTIAAAGRTAFSTSALRFLTSDGTAALERMRLDASGNLGLGVTPSAWATLKVVQLPGGSLAGFDSVGNRQINVIANSYFDGGNFRYIGTDPATRYAQFNGQHTWFTAPSGTAGNAISFTQAMTLDASGNLGVGVTSIAGFRVDILSTGTDVAVRARASNSNEVLRVESTGTSLAQIRFINTSVNNTYISADGTALTFATNAQERARIPAAGGMVVGTAALATSATDGFLYVPTCAGTPTGTPTTQTGTAPIVVNTTNNKLYFYSGGQWRDAGP